MCLKPVITLTTDFGSADTYVAQMKGVIFTIAPQVRIVDVTHDVSPQDIAAGALALESVVEVFTGDTIHVAVVDPGVGGARAAVALETQSGRRFVGPDNGIFTAVLERDPLRTAVKLTNPAYHRPCVSATFHGRDIFAPVAAHLANGTPLDQLGEPTGTLQRLDLPVPVHQGDTIEAHVIHVDRFGNLITDVTLDDMTGVNHHAVQLQIAGTTIDGIHRTFADVSIGQPIAYIGSSGRLEIAVRHGSAARTFNAMAGTRVLLLRKK